MNNYYHYVQNKLQLNDRDGNLKSSYLIITAEELGMDRDEVILEMSGFKLDKKDFFGKSDPFLEIYKLTDTGNYTLVYKTDVSKKFYLYDFTEMSF